MILQIYYWFRCWCYYTLKLLLCLSDIIIIFQASEQIVSDAFLIAFENLFQYTIMQKYEARINEISI